MSPILFAVGAAIVVGTAIVTAMRYNELPDRVPIHFGLDGAANSYGPRFAVWLLVVLQVVLAITYATTSLLATGRSRGILIMGDCILAICAWGQLQIIRAATSRKNRIDTVGFLLVLGAVVAAGILASLFIP